MVVGHTQVKNKGEGNGVLNFVQEILIGFARPARPVSV